MNTEYEVKFLNTDHDQIRKTLIDNNANLEQPMRLMRRVIIDTPHMKDKNGFIRIRDEGKQTTLTYKQFDAASIEGAKEHEVSVSDFETTVALFESAGLPFRSYQESKRETWTIDDVEVVLDEWPWLEPYIEIEGPSAASVEQVTQRLGLRLESGVYGDIMAAYRAQYPHIDESTTVGNIKEVKFSSPLPEMLSDRK